MSTPSAIKSPPKSPGSIVERIAEARLPTRYGIFQLTGYCARPSGEEFVALHVGRLSPNVPVLVRIHSQCLTSESFGSIRCDCAAQLQGAMEVIQREGLGVIVYQFQEGRGIGIINKIRAYGLQDTGADTVEANESLGFSADLRVFEECAEVLRDLNVRNIRLISNNPAKLKALSAAGFSVVERVSLPIRVASEALRYLETKREKLGHWLPDGIIVDDT
jgi:3,4-dihydroxy 2-butanone 4-phosphate synthase/GTP cyclohydrolase II